jgi:hypothetical protein
MVETGHPRRLGQAAARFPPPPVSSARGSTDVPTLFRFFATLAILAGLVFAGMFALATFIQPTPREMSVAIPASKLQPGNR